MTVELVWQLRGEEGFKNREKEELLELVCGNECELTEQELVELIKLVSEEEEKGEEASAEPQQKDLMLETLANIVSIWSSFKSTTYDHDPLHGQGTKMPIICGPDTSTLQSDAK